MYDLKVRPNKTMWVIVLLYWQGEKKCSFMKVYDAMYMVYISLQKFDQKTSSKCQKL